MTRDSILATIAANKEALRELGAVELALFGSYARGEATEASDIDFLVELEESTFDSYMSVREFLESLFQRKIDLVMKSAIRPRLRESILREAVRAA
jgi:uncharacterized protein